MLIKEQVDSAITLKDANVLGAILAGLRDLAGKNILEAPVFRGQFNRQTVATINKKANGSDEFWQEIAAIIINVPDNASVRRKLPGIALATVQKYGPSSGNTGDFWKVGQTFRRAVERRDEQALCGVLGAADEAVSGELGRCPWNACTSFYGLSEPYREEVLDLLESEGLDEIRQVEKEDIWFIGSDQQYHHALARFILAHKEFWSSMCHDMTLFILNETGEQGVIQFLSML